MWSFGVSVATVIGVLLTISGLYTLAVRLRLLPAELPVKWGNVGRIFYVILYAAAWPVTNVFLMLFGNISLHRRVKRIEASLDELKPGNPFSLFSQIAGLDPKSDANYHIVFSHKEGAHPQNLPSERRISGFPFDESEAIMRLYYQLARILPAERVRPTCSHLYPSADDIITGPYAIVGSPKNNELCRVFMDDLEEQTNRQRLLWEHHYVIKSGRCEGHADAVAYLKANSSSLPAKVPDPTPPASPSDVLVDYAVFMRLPNLLAADGTAGSQDTVLVLAGCKAAGQLALTEWLSNTTNLEYLVRRYSGRHFYVLLKTKYQFVENGLPKILNIEKLYDNTIDPVKKAS